METQKLPNATMALVLGIASLLCCCFYGLGIIPAVIALVLANKDTKKYKLEPELYSNYNNVKTAKIIAIIGIVLNLAYFVYFITLIATIGMDGIMEQYEIMQEQYNL
ncbi:CCC motif membrane protein [Sinomicrobium sp.]